MTLPKGAESDLQALPPVSGTDQYDTAYLEELPSSVTPQAGPGFCSSQDVREGWFSAGDGSA